MHCVIFQLLTLKSHKHQVIVNAFTMIHLLSISRDTISSSPYMGANAIMSLHGYNLLPTSPVLSYAPGSGQYIPKAWLSSHCFSAPKVQVECTSKLQHDSQGFP